MHMITKDQNQIHNHNLRQLISMNMISEACKYIDKYDFPIEFMDLEYSHFSDTQKNQPKFIDYIGLSSSSMKDASCFENYASLFEEMRNLAKSSNITILTAKCLRDIDGYEDFQKLRYKGGFGGITEDDIRG